MATKLIPGVGYIEESRAAQTLIPGIGYVEDPGVAASGATALSLTGPTTAIVSQASQNFVVAANGSLSGSVVVTPSDNGGNGYFTPATVTLNSSLTSATFTYTATTSGNKVVSITNDGGLENPSTITVDCTAAPVGEITSVTVSGQRITVSGTFDEEPVSGTASLTAASTPNGAVSQTNVPVVLSPSNKTFSVFFDAVPGDYSQESVTLVNEAGQVVLTSNTAITIIPISGSPEAETAATSYAVSGPSNGNVGAAASFSSTANGSTTATVTVSDNGGGGTFSTTTFNADGGSFSYTPNSVGTKNLTFTNDGGLTNQTAISFSATPVPDTQDPVMFGGLSVTNVTHNSMSVSYQAGSDNVAIARYEYSSNGGTDWTNNQLNLSFNLISLSSATTYELRVRAVDSSGRYSNVLSASQATSAAPTAPGAPTNVTVTVGVGSVAVSFQPPVSNGGSPLTGFKVIASTGQEQLGTSSPINIVVPSDTDITVTVVAINAIGESDPSQPSATFRVNSPLPNITVQIIPGTTMVPGGGTQQFTAIVTQPDVIPSQVVNWSASSGTISPEGLFTAPAATAFAQTITLTAISAVNTSRFDTATAIVPAVVNGGQEQQTPTRHHSGSIINRYGVAVEGALITVTNADTGEKADLFADKDLEVPIFNPLISNELGMFEFYVQAIQCSYSVRGKGIEPYTRSNIFDVINNVDLTPITSAITALDNNKVSFAALDAVTSDLAPKASVTALSTELESAKDDLLTTAQTLDNFETSTTNALNSLTSRVSTLENAASGSAPVVDVHKFVTGGAGTLANPWIGWDTSITWSESTQYDFRDGVYGYVNSPNFGKNFLCLNGRENTRFKHSGTGNALILDAGSNSTDTVVGIRVKVKLESNSGATGGVYARGVAQSSLDIDFNNVPNVCFTEVSCLANTYKLRISPVKRTVSVTPVSLFASSKRASGYGNGGSKFDLMAENCSGTAVSVTEHYNSEFTGILQYNNIGLLFSSSVRGCKVNNLTASNNITSGVDSSGEWCMFSNVRASTAIYKGKNSVVVGGVYDTLVIGGSNHTIGPLTYGVNGGRLEKGGTNTTLRDLFNAMAAKHDADRIREVDSLSVLGKATFSAETFSVGGSEIFKNTKGQICFGTSQPTGVARVTLFNTDNTANDINFQSLLQSFSTTAYHYKANSGGATDVMFISGNGNVTNLNNSYGAISDERLKTNIVDATPKLAELLQVRVVNYNLINNPANEKLLGVLAGELEELFPGLIQVDENGIRSVKYSVFIPIMIKAIQELNAKIEAQ